MGVGLAIASLIVMLFLSWAQRRTGKALGSNAVVANSTQTLLCTYLSAVLLLGLILNATLGWSWADPVAALVIAGVAVREGIEAWRGEGCCAPVASGVKVYYVRGRIAAYLNDLLAIGVDGFRLDASKHLVAVDIAAIKARLSRPVRATATTRRGSAPARRTRSTRPAGSAPTSEPRTPSLCTPPLVSRSPVPPRAGFHPP